MPDVNGKINLPVQLNSSSERLERHGLYLMDDGFEMILYVGKAIHPELCRSVFGLDYSAIQCGKTSLGGIAGEYGKRIQSIVMRLTVEKRRLASVEPYVYVLKEDSQDMHLKSKFLGNLIEDKMGEVFSYVLFLNHIREQVSKS
jgi:protein transport protein SEC24